MKKPSPLYSIKDLIIFSVNMRYRIRIILLLLFLYTLNLYTQLSSQSPLEKKIDSLSLIIESSSDTTKANAYYQLGRQYVLNDSFAKGIAILNEGAAYSKSIDFHMGTGKIYEYIGIANDIDGNLDEALVAYEEARKYHLKVPNNERSLNLLDINIGVAYYFAGDMGKALEYYLKAYHEAKRIEQNDHLAKLVNNIAIIYRRSEKYEEALKYYHESISIKRGKGDQAGEANTYQNIGLLYSYMDQLDSSMYYFDKAKDLMVSIKASQRDIDFIDYIRAEGYYNMEDFDRAFQLISRFEKNNFSTLSKSVRLNGKLVLADLYAKRNQNQNTIRVMDEVEQEIGTDDYSTELRQVYKFRGKAYMSLMNYKAAAIDFKQAEILLDSIQSKERQALESEMQTKYSTIQKEQEIEKLILEQELKDFRINQQRIGLWVISSVLALLSFLLYNIFKQKKKIEVQSRAISRSAEEKDILLREIHHRVKNNLQVISSLLGIQGRGIKDQKAKEAIQEGRNRVQSMSLIHQNLYKKDNLTGIEMIPYIEKLSHHLLSTYQVDEGVVDIKTEVDDLTLDVETVVPIGLIINELMSNSLKYAFPNGRNGVITISLREVDKALLLSLSDDGIGLSKEELLTKTDSFGHSLIRAFKSKLDAEISISSHKGTQVSLIIQNYKKILIDKF